jgi:hypothetical protein
MMGVMGGKDGGLVLELTGGSFPDGRNRVSTKFALPDFVFGVVRGCLFGQRCFPKTSTRDDSS